MKIFETWGVHKVIYFFEIHQKSKHHYHNINELFTNKRNYYFSMIAFFIGMLMTLPIIYVEVEYDVFNMHHINLEIIWGYIALVILFVFLEFYLLFLLGFYLLSYYLYYVLKIYKESHIDAVEDKEFLAMLVRTVMELPEPEIVRYDINHKENGDQEWFIWAFFYKLKVVMTNFILKFIVKKALTRSSLRLYTPYVATLGTGVWDGIVFYKTIKDSQYKIVVRLVLLYLLEHKRVLLSQENYIKAIIIRYFHYCEYNNNFDYILSEIYTITSFDYVVSEILKDDILNKVNNNFLLLLYALKEKKYTKKEKLIIKKLGNQEEFKLLRESLVKADFNYLYYYIDSKIND